MRKVMLLAMAAAAISTGVQAQGLKIGIEAGLNLANLKQEIAEINSGGTTYTLEKKNGTYKAGIRGGVAVELDLSDHIGIQTGLFYAMKGRRDKEEESQTLGTVTVTGKTETKLTLNYIELPVNFVYKFGDVEALNFMVYGGVYVAYGIGGNLKTEYSQSGGGFDTAYTEKRDVNIGSTKPTIDLATLTVKSGDDYRALDYGVQIGVGVNLPFGLYGKAQYQTGLGNIGNGTFDPNSTTGALTSGYAKNSSISVSVGYWLKR